MIIKLGDTTTLIQVDDQTVEVTRLTMSGKLASHLIRSPYSAQVIADWLQKRQRRAAELIQDAFPEMKAEDREFLMTGITPAEWDRMFNRPGWRAARRKIINR